LIEASTFVRPESCRSEHLQPAQARMPAAPLIQSQAHRLVELLARGEQFSLTRRDPAFPCGSLTLWAVPISAAIVGDGTMPATGAFIEMTAECGGTTPRNG